MLILLGHLLVQVVQCNAVPVYIHVILHVVTVYLCAGIPSYVLLPGLFRLNFNMLMSVWLIYLYIV